MKIYYGNAELDSNQVGAMDPITSPEQFFEWVVLPNYEDFQRDSGNFRKGINAILTAYHLSDWMWKTYQGKKQVHGAKGLTAYRKILVTKEPLFELLDAASIVMKHTRIDRSGNYEKTKSDMIGRDRMRCNDPCNVPLRPIRVRTHDDKLVLINEMMASVISMWKSELNWTQEEAPL